MEITRLLPLWSLSSTSSWTTIKLTAYTRKRKKKENFVLRFNYSFGCWFGLVWFLYTQKLIVFFLFWPRIGRRSLPKIKRYSKCSSVKNKLSKKEMAKNTFDTRKREDFHFLQFCWNKKRRRNQETIENPWRSLEMQMVQLIQIILCDFYFQLLLCLNFQRAIYKSNQVYL